MGNPSYVVPPGTRFGQLVVISDGPPRVGGATKRPRRTMLCRCDCGTEKVVLLELLRDGRAVSCGCYRRKQTALSNTKNKTRHGMRKHELYSTWNSMMHRCYDPAVPAFKRYGGRGITVYEPWHDVTLFIRGVEQEIGPRPEGKTVDRIDNDGNYEPGNIKWSTDQEQSLNQGPRQKRPAALRADLETMVGWPSKEVWDQLLDLLS